MVRELDPDCNVRAVDGPLSTVLSSMAMKRDHPLFEALSNAMRTLLNDGTVERLKLRSRIYLSSLYPDH